jgi:hypothetical protein
MAGGAGNDAGEQAQGRAGGNWMNTTFPNLRFCGVDAASVSGQNDSSSLLFVSTAGREAGSSESASAFVGKENAEWVFSPRPGQGSPTLGANCSIPKKRHSAFAGRRAGDAITGGVTGRIKPQFVSTRKFPQRARKNINHGIHRIHGRGKSVWHPVFSVYSVVSLL